MLNISYIDKCQHPAQSIQFFIRPLKLITVSIINQPKLYKWHPKQKLAALPMWHTEPSTVFRYLEGIYQDCTLTVSLWNA